MRLRDTVRTPSLGGFGLKLGIVVIVVADENLGLCHKVKHLSQKFDCL